MSKINYIKGRESWCDRTVYAEAHQPYSAISSSSRSTLLECLIGLKFG